MTVNIEYEAEKQLGIPYEEIINEGGMRVLGLRGLSL